MVEESGEFELGQLTVQQEEPKVVEGPGATGVDCRSRSSPAGL